MIYPVYRNVISVLKEHCKVAYPIIVRRIKMKDDGNCCLHKKKFYININRKSTENDAINTLLHEWAHARAWNHLHDNISDDEFDKKCHDATWGIAYSEVYQVYETHFLRDDKKCK